MNNLEKIILSILTFSLVSCVACEKKEKVSQPRYSQKIEQDQFLADDVSSVIDKYYSTIQNKDRDGYLNCLSKRMRDKTRDEEERYPGIWERLVNSIGKYEIKSRKLVGSSKNRRIYKVVEVYKIYTGEIREEPCYYYLVKEDGSWKIDDFHHHLDTD